MNTVSALSQQWPHYLSQYTVSNFRTKPDVRMAFQISVFDSQNSPVINYVFENIIVTTCIHTFIGRKSRYLYFTYAHAKHPDVAVNQLE